MKCLDCQRLNPAGAKFCEACGVSLPRSCPACGSATGASARFCAECGAPLQRALHSVVQATAEPSAGTVRDRPSADSDVADRRQAVVLFADISGYTALCARSDAERIQEMLGSFFEVMDRVVEAHGGKVFDRAGDAVMAVFGAPLAHGNDARRALRAALAMHTAVKAVMDCDGAPLRLHVGLASGEVVAAVISGGGKGKYSVTGDAVNLAARLDALAGPGETLISDALHAEVSGMVEAEARGQHVVKGFAAPMKVWCLLRMHEAGDSHNQPTRLPFVGRQAELRQLVGALDSVHENRCGTALLLRGDAGIGKSRLVSEFCARARERGFEVPIAHVLDFGVAKGQDAISMLLKAVLRIDVLDDEPRRRAALEDAAHHGLVTDDEAIFVNEWLGLSQPRHLAAIFDAMDNTTRLRRASEALAAVLQRAAGVSPQLIVVEDIHWASPELLRHLVRVTRAAAQAPMILLLTSRIDGDPIDKAWRMSIHGSALMTIDLSPLRPHEARLLAAGLVETSSRFALLCIERAEGNPLFLEQLLRSARGGDVSQLLPTVTPTIQSLVLERMDRLAPADRATLQAAAVLGKRFSLEDVRAVAGTPTADCDLLVAADLVRFDGTDFMFAHALIQEAIYSSTLKSRRRALHQAAARWFADREPVLQAEHLDRADDGGAATAYLRAAGAEAAGLRFEAALRLAERGLELATNAPRADRQVACELALLRGDVLREVGRSADSIVAFESAIPFAVDDRQRFRASMGIAAGHRVTGDFAAAMAALAQAEPVAEQLGLTVERSLIHHTRGNLLFSQGRIAECDREHGLALRFAEESGDRESQARAWSGMGDTRYAQGLMRSARYHFERCVDLGDGQIRIAGANRCMIGHCLWYENQLPAALAEVRAARDEAARLGVVPVLVFAQTSVTQLLVESGHFTDAAVACADALVLARRAGSRRYEATLLHVSAELNLRLGDRAQARADVEQALALARQTGLGFIGAALWGRMARAAGSPEERSRCLADGAALLKDTGLAHSHLWYYRDGIEANLAVRDWTAALAYAAALERAFPTEPLPWVGLIAERARAIVGAAQSPGDEVASNRLRAVRDTAVAAGNGWVMAGLDEALATA